MKGLRAFVGHSFRDKDQGLVRIFLDHFSVIAKSHNGFSWDHAEAAHPGSLSEKVLTKMRGKNVFIGICTQAERAIDDAVLSPTFFRRSYVKERDLEWKT